VTAPIVAMSGLQRIEPHLKIFRVGEVPRNDMGKVDRLGVLQAYSAQTGAPAASPAENFPETVGSA
jgi:hypothetical protein